MNKWISRGCGGQSVDEPISRLSIYTFSLLFREKIKIGDFRDIIPSTFLEL